jgi:hypothetical protein
MAKTKTTSFRAELEGVRLSAADVRRITSAIERTVFEELASLDERTDLNVARIRKEWLGLLVRRLRPGSIR